MEKFEFLDLRFKEEKEGVKVLFLRHFYFNIQKEDLSKIGEFKIQKNSIEFDASKKRAQKFYELIDRGLLELKNSITGKKTVYVHKGSGIPLIGNSSFGIVDRGSNLIEIKPVTGCNLSCIYCSVDQDKRQADFVVEKDYLVDELKKVVSIKKNDVEVHIGCHGEPLLYSPLVELVREVKAISGVERISMDTNTTLLTEKIVDDLVGAGMTRFNLSINALDDVLAKKIAGGGFSVKHAKDIAEYIKKRGVKLTLAPVFMKGINDAEMAKIVDFGKKLSADIGIQNFLKYQFGKNPVKEMPMEDFFERLKILELSQNIKLILKAEDFRIREDNTLKKPFKKGDAVDAVLVCDGRIPGEKIAVAKDRTISVYGCNKKIGSKVKVRITREKHNIFSGTIA